jgi:hypothetical protein
VVEISVGWVGELKSSHADVVESFVINTEGLVGVLNQLMNGESSIVWLDNGVRDLGGWDNGKGGHHSVGELLANLGDQKRTHTRTSSTTKRVGDLETLKAVTALSFPTNNIQNLINKLGTLSVMSLCPVVTSTGLAENEVIRAEELTERTGTDSIHSTWLQIDEDGTRHILVTGGLRSVSGGFINVDIDPYLIEIDVHALELKVRGTIVARGMLVGCKQEACTATLYDRRHLHARAIEAMLARDCLPISLSVLAVLVSRSCIKASRRRGCTHQKAAPI